MEKHVCRYSIVRFKPYPETGEFVNVGVVTVFPQQGLIDFKVEITHTKRVTDFFQNIDFTFYRKNARLFYKALDRVREKFDITPLIHREPNAMDEYFDLLTKEYDEIFCFSRPRVKFTKDVGNETKFLFDFFVQQNHLKRTVSHEGEMTTMVRKQLKRLNLLNQYADFVLDMHGGVDLPLPFCHFDENDTLKKAIRPIYLGYTQRQRIIEHGAGWYYRMKKAAEEDKLPEKMLVIIGGIDMDAKGERFEAINVIKDDIASLDDIEVTDDNRIESLESFVESA